MRFSSSTANSIGSMWIGCRLVLTVVRNRGIDYWRKQQTSICFPKRRPSSLRSNFRHIQPVCSRIRRSPVNRVCLVRNASRTVAQKSDAGSARRTAGPRALVMRLTLLRNIWWCRQDGRTTAFDADETAALDALGWRAGGGRCPDSALLLAAEEGALDTDVAARVREHVATCATCRLLVQDLAVVLAESDVEPAAARIRARIETASPRRARAPVWIGVAGLAAAAAIIWFLVVNRTAPPVPELQTATHSTVFVVDRPLIPAGDVDLTVRAATPRARSRIRLPSRWTRLMAGRRGRGRRETPFRPIFARRARAGASNSAPRRTPMRWTHSNARGR